MLDRVNFKGAALFAGNSSADIQIDRATAFGSTSTINKEDIFELGNSGIVEIIEDVNEVTMTIDANEYGSAKTLAVLAGKNPSIANQINFSTDFDNARVDIWSYIKGPSDVLYTQYMENCYLTGYSANFVVDGNSTESYTLVSDNKKWLLNDYKEVGRTTSLTHAGGAFTGTVVGATKVKVVKVWVNGVETNEFTDNTTGNNIDITVPGADSLDTVTCRYFADDGGLPFVPNTASAAAKRRGHVELYLVSGHTITPGSGAISGGTSVKQFRIQSVSVDVSLDRENLAQLGSTYYYARPLTLPITVNVSFDLTFSDLEMFAKFTGKSTTSDKEIRIDDFIDNIGMIVKVFDKRDIDNGTRVSVKEVHVPYLIPTDEAWNVSLDGNATQTFSFRSHEIFVKDVSN